MERKYIAFISYRHAELDSAVAKQLHTFIEQYTIPRSLRKNGVKKLGLVFRDQEELPISSNLSDDICKALDNSQYLIVVCSKNTAQSPWVGREIEYFLSHHDQQHTLAALASGEPSDVFPRALTVRTNAMGELEEVEPLAIDVRAKDLPSVKKAMKREITRLYAALIGCPYDALVMRQQRRKHRQLAAIMGGILAVVMSFLTVTLVKNHEIDLKNQELEEQKAAVQLRESELLTEKGMDAIAAGDAQSALTYFLGALPSQTEDRPYYAPAEQGLISALGIHDAQSQPYRIFQTVLEQENPVTHFCLSPDGTRAMTFDQYSLATCFDTGTGEVLWSRQLADSEVEEIVAGNTLPGVVVCVGKSIYYVDWQTGETLWSYTDILYESPELSPDETVLAFRGYTYADEKASYVHAYVFADTATGEELQRIDFGKSQSAQAYTGMVDIPEGAELPNWWFPETLDDSSRNGSFSLDGNLFSFCYKEEVYNVSNVLNYAVVDLSTGTCQVVWQEALELDDAMTAPLRAFPVDDGTALLIIQQPRSTYSAFRIQKIDLATGELLWSTDSEEAEHSFFGKPIQVAEYRGGVLISRGQYLYTVDTQTGEIPICNSFASDILFLSWTDSQELGIVCVDGRYSPAWIGGSGVMMADTYFDILLPMGEALSAQFYNGGLAHYTEADGYVTGMTVHSDGLADGYVAVQPAENDCAIAIKRAVCFEDAAQQAHVSLLDGEEYIFHPQMSAAGENRFAIGPVTWSNADGKYENAYRFFDAGTETVGKDLAIPASDVLLLSDGSNYLFSDSQTGIFLGEEALLTVTQIPFPDGSGNTDPSHIYHSAVQAFDGKILTAALGTEEILYWLDGQNKTSLALPEGIRAYHTGDGVWQRFIMAGTNGSIIVADYTDTEQWAIQGFYVYTLSLGSWAYVPVPQALTGGKIVTAQSSHWLLVCDTENNLSIFDMLAGDMLYQFSLNLPLNSVKQISFVAGDQYIAVQSANNIVSLHRMDTGELLFRQQMTGSASQPVKVAVDEVRNRLYLWCNSEQEDIGYCIDPDSWTVLAQIPGLLHYDAAANRVYRITKDPETYKSRLTFYVFPDLEEMTTLGNALLEQ